MDVLELTAQCIVSGTGKARFAKLHERLGTDNISHVFIVLCILDGCQTREEVHARRKREFIASMYLELEKLGYIAHSQTCKKHRRYYSLTALGESKAEAWHATMTKALGNL